MVAFSVNPANLRKAIQDAQTRAAASKKAPTPTAVVQRAAPTASYVPGFTPSLQTTQPVTATEVPASSVGLGGQTTQPVATTTAPANLPATIKVYDRNLGYIDMPNPAIEQAAMAAIQNDWMSRPYSQVFRDRPNYDAYDPATAEYMKGLDAYVKQFGLFDNPAMNIGGMTLDPKKITYKERSQFGLLPEYSYQDANNPIPALPYGVSLPPGIGNYSPADYARRISAAVTGKTPYEQLLEYQFAIAPHDEDQNTQWANARYNTPIALVDNRTGKVVHAGVGFDAAMKVAELSQNLSNTQGRKASYSIFTADPGTTNWKYQAGDKPDKSVLGQIASVALPALGAILLPGVGGLTGALGSAGAAGVGAAAGSALSGALQGQSIGDILKNAAIAGGTTFAGGSLLGPGGSTVSKSVSNGLDAVTKAAVAAGLEAAPITVVGGSLAPILSGAIGGLTASQLSDALAKIGQQTTPNVPMAGEAPGSIVTGKPTTPVPGAGALGGALTGAVTPTQPGVTYDPVANEIVVAENKPTTPAPGAGSAIGAGAGATIPSPVNPSVPEYIGDQITVSKPKPTDVGATAGSLIGGTSLLTPGQNAVVDQALQGETTPEAKSDLQKVIDYLRLGGLGVGLIGDLIGGKSTASPGIMPGGPGTLNPTFSAKLPSPNLPAATPRPATALPQTEQDWYRYGYGPEQSFFSNVPQGARNTSTAYTGYAEGGSTGYGQRSRSSFAVGGPGDGRDDKIPAVLSDGEYVMDAETVAMLGNGSSKAGAEALDRFRVNIRKHKGRDLAKGKFSANAKKPEQYLKGRK